MVALQNCVQLLRIFDTNLPHARSDLVAFKAETPQKKEKAVSKASENRGQGE